MTRGRLKSILLATRSTSALELGTIDAIRNGRFKNCLKNRVLTRREQSSCTSKLSSREVVSQTIRLLRMQNFVEFRSLDISLDSFLVPDQL